MFLRSPDGALADNPSVPAWALDVAAIELALARARTLHPTAMEKNALVACPTQPAYPGIVYTPALHSCVATTMCVHCSSPRGPAMWSLMADVCSYPRLTHTTPANSDGRGARMPSCCSKVLRNGRR